MPYNRIWRTGANEATEVTFTGEVLIEGQKLAAGKYTLFTIPTENEWTVIFNKVTHQWGHFSYNPEFDVLKVKAQPQPAEHQEYVNIGFENLTSNSVQIVVHWEKIKVPFKVELEPVKTAGN